MLRKNSFTAWSPIVACLALMLSTQALGSTRKVFFSVVGRNYAENPATASQSSKCIVSVTNSSTTNQDITISFDGSKSEGVGAGGPVSGNTNSFAATVPNASQTASTTFTAYPLGSTGYQNITCSGYVTVTDSTAASPGFVTANGTLVTFYESSGLTSLLSTGAGSWGTAATFTQTPIPINAGKPF